MYLKPLPDQETEALAKWREEERSMAEYEEIGMSQASARQVTSKPETLLGFIELDDADFYRRHES